MQHSQSIRNIGSLTPNSMEVTQFLDEAGYIPVQKMSESYKISM